MISTRRWEYNIKTKLKKGRCDGVGFSEDDKKHLFFQFHGSVHHISVNENNLMQQS